MRFDFNELASRIAKVADGEVQIDKPLAPYTSYKIGGPTAIWVAPTTEAAVGRVLKIIYECEIPLFVLGRGSNTLVSDQGWNGVTLYVGENLSGWTFQNREANVLAGTRLVDLVRSTVEKGLAGMELLAGIPGGVGGALRMNAGAFGQEIENVTVSVGGFERNGAGQRIDRNVIDFGYRQAPALDKMIITRGRFRFERYAATELKKRMEDILMLRSKKQPLKFPSCGSVFKRPAGYFAGALIEEAGMKGKRIGGAMVSRKHAGFILNVNNASATDVYALIRTIKEKVFERFGIRLKREVKLIGKFD